MSRSLLAILADGHIHSGESLGGELNLSRAAVWKQIQKLVSSGLPIESIRGQGYRLMRPVVLLERECILDFLDPDASDLLSGLDIKWSIPSTNVACLEMLAAHEIDGGFVCLTEYQTSGRGRRGRRWISTPASNICMSITWKFSGGIEVLDGLSLAVGVCVADVLKHQLGLMDVKLKWPNDILCRQRKMGGILIEMIGDAAGPCYVVIGLGLNVSLTSGLQEEYIDQPVTDLETEMPGVTFSRNVIVSLLLSHLLPSLKSYERVGFKSYRQRWQSYDAFANQEVIVHQGDSNLFVGLANGVSETGSLLVSVNGVVRHFRSGEVSLRCA